MLSGYTYGVACCVFAPVCPDQTKEHWTKNPLGSGEPYNYHILNRYFDEYFPRAIANAAAMKKMHSNSTTANDTYTYMTQAWVVALYLDCPRSGVTAWPGSFDIAPIDVDHTVGLAQLLKARQRGRALQRNEATQLHRYVGKGHPGGRQLL